MKKILLINPPRNLRNPKRQFIAPPLGLAYIASFLRQHKYEVKIIDAIAENFENVEEVKEGVYRCGLSWGELRSRIEEYNPDVVGISCVFTPRFKNVIKISQIAKEVNGDIKVVVGGVHASYSPQEFLSKDTVDFVIMGEGEVPFLRLVENLNGNSNDLSQINGIGFRNSENQEVINSRTDLINNLDELPLPAWDLLPMERYFRSNRDALTGERRHISIITSRGCPYNCSFCSSGGFWKGKWRKRSAEKVLEEIEYLIRRHKIKEISFEDDNLTLDPVRFEKLCLGIIKEGFNIRWNTPHGISVNNLDRDLIKLMKRSGCTRLHFGIESGDEYILYNVIKKGIRLQKAKEIISYCKREGIITLGYFILGMPGETEESIEHSIEFAKGLDLDEISLFIATPFPHTELYRVCKEKGYLRRECDEIEVEDAIENEVFFETPLISGEELRKWRSRFYVDFYKTKALQNPFYYLKRAIRDPALITRYARELLSR